MSVLNKKPFIQSLIASLSSDERTSLLSVINGSGTTPKYSLVLRDLSVSTPIERCVLETKTHLYNMYKIYKSGKITFLSFGQGQNMGIYQVSYPYYEKELKGRINESLTINELRRYLEFEGPDGSGVTEEELEAAISDKATIYEVENVQDIPQDILSKIKGGDIVNTGEDVFICSYFLAGDSFRLVTGDTSSIYSVHYTSTGETQSGWVFDEDSEIDFSSLGGTKLYKHTLQLNITEGSTEELTIINNSSSPITSLSNVANIINGQVSDRTDPELKYYSFMKIIIEDDVYIMFGSYKVYIESGFTLGTDTVTEL